MANRRFGGGGPQRGGPRGFGQNVNVNPWQGNNGPSMGGPMGDSQNLQTRLALALTRLLQTPQVDPPSLLSLNTSPGPFNQDFHRNGGGGGGRRDQFRRNEPYNKNQRGGWRVGQGGGGNRGPQGGGGGSNQNRNNRNQSGNKSHGGNQKDRFRSNKNKPPSSSSVSNKANPASSSSAAASIKTEKEKEPSKDEKAADNVADENRDEDGAETKRDWKEEKNTGDDGGEKVAAGETTDDGDESKKDTSKYAGLPNSLFHCFVCNKSMWDGDSYKNHIRGKAHVQMLNSLEESFQITVKILRENMRLAEEKKMIEWNRMMRNNRKHMNRNEPESHCNMCDLKFMGKIIAHRKTEGHQRLKRFLHPNCDTCNLEFPSRMEWVEHRFTPEHLFKLKEVLETKTGDETEGHIVEEEVEWDNDPILQESLQCEDDNPVLELDDDLANLYNRVPNYRPNRPVGKNSLKAVDGFFCEVCKVFLRTETDSQNHLKSEKHYHEFVSAVKDKFRAKVEKEEQEGNWKRKKAEAEANENKDGETQKGDGQTKDGSDMYDPEEACKEEVVEGDEDAIADIKDMIKSEDVTMMEDSSDAVNEEEQVEDEVKDEPEGIVEAEEKETVSPATRRRGNVRNGAGPKSKRGRKI